MFQPGSRILAQYSNAAGEPLHERVVLAKSFGSFYTLCSPDEDAYTECIGGTEDIITYWLVAADGSRPPLPAGRLVYGFGDFTCFDGAAGAAKIREGIADAVVHRGTHRPDLGPDPSEALAEAAAIRAEGGAAQPAGLFGVVAAAPAGGGAPPPAPGAAPAVAGSCLQKKPLRQVLHRAHSCSFPLSSGILDMAFFKETWAESVEFVKSFGGHLSLGTTPPTLRVSATSIDVLSIAVALVEDYVSDINEEYILWVEPFASAMAETDWAESVEEHGEHGEQPARKKSRVQQRLFWQANKNFRPASS